MGFMYCVTWSPIILPLSSRCEVVPRSEGPGILEYMGLYVNAEMREEGVRSGKGFAVPSYELYGLCVYLYFS